MISDIDCNRVYYSAKLPEVCPKTFRSVTAILNKYGVPHSGLVGTKDIWVRDFMPIQTIGGAFLNYTYMPDYLRDDKQYVHSISDPVEVCKANDIPAEGYFDWIRLDGGNVVYFGRSAIMTSKVLEENPGTPPSFLLERLEKMLEAEIILLPWDVNEEFGHADGIVRFVDSDTVIMTNYSQFDRKMADRFRNILKANFKNVHELHFNVKNLNENSWAYINWLQTDKVLVLPAFGIAEDEQAFQQIERWMPEYKGRIEMADATDLIMHKGCLNCATWTINSNPCAEEVPKQKQASLHF
ncbi:MAG: agmatine deiminase family protein [Bacteroidales bacterium]|nr:agmatine deiminase family protein [Bacteroidales bacterium]